MHPALRTNSVSLSARTVLSIVASFLVAWTPADDVMAAATGVRRGAPAKTHESDPRPGETRLDRMVVKFAEGSAVRLRNGALTSLTGTVDLTPFDAWLGALPGVEIVRHFARDEAALDADRAAGLRRGCPDLADLNLYYRIEFASGDQTAATLQGTLDALRGFASVETAFLEPIAAPPIAPDHRCAPSPDPRLPLDRGSRLPTPDYTPLQGYLGLPPAGINATAVWGFAGGRGAAVRIIDIEGAWLWSHEDLPAPFHEGGTQFNDLSWRNHGTAVVGEMAGKNNGFGVTGIASDLQVGCVSIATMGVAAAIDLAASHLESGDLFLIELHAPGPNSNGQGQYGYLPMEYWQDNFDAIQTAVANGRICIEAGGNGEQNLDDPIYQELFDRTVRYSGAIMVGAGTPTGLVGEWYTNYGSRLDLNGWGSSVVTAGYGNLQGGPETQWYTSSFAGTSSASPIVAGAVASLQGMCKAEWNTVLSGPLAMQILHDTGTPWSGTKQIGNRPDILAARALLLEGVAVVTGHLVSAHSGAPVGGALVELPDDGITVLTDTGGGFELTVPAGTHPIRVTEFFHQTLEDTFTAGPGEALALELTMTPKRLGALSGTFVGPDGSPLIGGRVLFPGTPIDPEPMSGTPHYAVDGIPAGDYTVLFGLIPTFGAAARTVTILPERTTTTNPLLAAAETFDPNDGGYSAQAPWAWGSPEGPAPDGAFSGSRLWATNLSGDYGDNQTAYLTLPIQEFPAADRLWMTMTHWYDLEGGFDGGNVEIRSGETWTSVEPVGGYPMAGLSGLLGQAGYSGYSAGWVPAVFDLTPFLGGAIEIRFHFGSDGGVTAPGWYIDDVAFDTGEMPASVDPDARAERDPARVSLACHPNPSQAGTSLRFWLESSGAVDVRLFDPAGRQVRHWAPGRLEEGPHAIAWDGRDALGTALPSGIYLCRLEVDGRTLASRRFVRLR